MEVGVQVLVMEKIFLWILYHSCLWTNENNCLREDSFKGETAKSYSASEIFLNESMRSKSESDKRLFRFFHIIKLYH